MRFRPHRHPPWLGTALRRAGLAALIVLAWDPVAARAEGASPASPAVAEVPAAADLLFETSPWGAAPAGTVLHYGYTRRGGNEALFGPPITDRIVLDLAAGKTAETRDVRVAMFTGERRVPAGPFEDVGYNPVLVLFLEHHVAWMSGLLKANPRYLKTTIRAALRDRATVTRTHVALNGRSVPGWQVVVHPFAEDANRVRMRGLESIGYTFVTADAVRGAIVGIEVAADTQDGRLIEEKLTYDPPPG